MNNVVSMAPPPHSAAEKAFLGPIPKTTNKSVYIRFKTFFVQDAKTKGRNPSNANVIRSEWDKVKHRVNLNTEHCIEDKENPNQQLCIWLHQAKQDMKADKEANENALLEWSKAFNQAAPSYLQSLVDKPRNVYQADDLSGAIKKAQSAIKVWPEAAGEVLFSSQLEAANRLLKDLCLVRDASQLCTNLCRLSPQGMMAHAREFVQLKQEVAELQHLKAEKDETDEEYRALADKLKPEICRHLKKEMRYEPSLKEGWKTITYRRGGVTPEIFQQAFDLPDAKTKVATIPNSEIDSKALRFGAHLEYHSIVAKLQGTDLSVIGKYIMTR
ncbi:expressed unknown protein [Seminavis robusta]|uniref:Uncharacterized protein n=1 Tax=Seminavis robusta TaxID=568900 RepID=A0A9N8H5I6_9STRA|nr:expressed unknown protein [Seminavis robusta]|eukprot:Sro87_g045970.1 n/a (328) ;mRNA; f:22180-23163